MSADGTLVEDKMRRFKGEYANFSFKECPIYTHDGASAKFSTNSHEMDYSADMYIEHRSACIQPDKKAKSHGETDSKSSITCDKKK